MGRARMTPIGLNREPTNAIDAIKGKVPGVDITSTGNRPGEGVRVRIRGHRREFAQGAQNPTDRQFAGANDGDRKISVQFVAFQGKAVTFRQASCTCCSMKRSGAA